MARPIRYATLLRELAARHSIAAAGPHPAVAAAHRAGAAVLRPALLILLFLLIVQRQPLAGGWLMPTALAALAAGLCLFIHGARAGLLALGDRAGRAAAAWSRPAPALAGACLLGFALACAEPALGLLRLAGAGIQAEAEPYLYALLNRWPGALLGVIALSAGAGVALGMLRLRLGWRLRPMLLALLVIALGLSAHLMFDPELDQVPGFAWDCGVAAIGPVAALLLLACGNGVAGARVPAQAPLAGFGIVALATLAPVVGVLLCAMMLAETVSVTQLLEDAVAPASVARRLPLPWSELLACLRALLPAVLLLPLARHADGALLRRVLPALALCLAGLYLLRFGMAHGLLALAGQPAAQLANLFAQQGGAAAAYPAPLGIALAALFAGALLYCAVRAEPALEVFAATADRLSHGLLRRAALLRTAAAGAALAALVVTLAIVLDIAPAWIVLGGAGTALLLGGACDEDAFSAAWDSAGIAVGPIALPLLLLLGTGLMQVLDAEWRFGLPALLALGPVLALQFTHLRMRRMDLQQRRRRLAELARA